MVQIIQKYSKIIPNVVPKISKPLSLLVLRGLEVLAPRFWNLKCLVAPKILKPLSFLVFGSLKVLELKLPYCPTNVRTPIVSRINGI